MPADHELDIAVSQPGPQSSASCRHNAGGGCLILAGMLDEQGLVEEERDRPSAGRHELAIQPAALLEFALKLRAKKLGVEPDEDPFPCSPGPAVNRESAIPAGKPLDVDNLRGVLTRGLVADVMIARQGQ